MKKDFYFAEDIMEIMKYKKSKSEKIIRELNQELKEMGFKAEKGRIVAKYFRRRFNLD